MLIHGYPDGNTSLLVDCLMDHYGCTKTHTKNMGSCQDRDLEKNVVPPSHVSLKGRGYPPPDTLKNVIYLGHGGVAESHTAIRLAAKSRPVITGSGR